MKLFLKILLGSVLTLAVVAVALLGYLAVKSPGTTLGITGPDGKPLAGSIAVYEQVELGGYKQWVLMRGNDATKPVLLILHGGPGSPEMAMVRYYHPELEKYFVVVNWDQLGAGKSYSPAIPKEAMTINNFVNDAEQLVQHLKKRFNKEKIYIEGHSWGSALGALLAQRIPQDIKAYIGIGQISNMVESEKAVFDKTLELAKKAGDKKLINRLSGVSSLAHGEWQKTFASRECSMKYGGLVYKNPLLLLGRVFAGNSEYTLNDKFVKYYSGSRFSLNAMWDELMQGDMYKSAATWKVPVYILAGRHDLTVDGALAEKYFNFLKAPKKKFFWFENSAHMCSYEEPAKYTDIMVNKVLKENE